MVTKTVIRMGTRRKNTVAIAKNCGKNPKKGKC